MKLHLPISLRKCLMACLSAAWFVTCNDAQGGIMHEDATFQTYTDYAQNMGYYVQGAKVNALLQHIRTNEDKGYVIYYTDGTAPYVISLEQGIINSAGVDDIGAQNAVAPTYTATVLHNGSINASYGARSVGSGHSIKYAAIDIRNSNVYRLAPYWQSGTVQYDYMLQRQSKLQTDAVWIPATSIEDLSALSGGHLYHIGAGSKAVWSNETNSQMSLTGAYSYITGGINKLDSLQIHDGDGNISAHQNGHYYNGIGANLEQPLPNIILAGDSGSPSYIYNAETGQYEYLAAQQSGGGTYGQARGNVKWTHETLESHKARVDMSNDSVVYLNAVTNLVAAHADSSGNSSLEYSGYATDSDGNILAEYSAVHTGVNTWGDLSGLKDTQNWYAYDANKYLNLSDPDLYFNQNLVFTPTQSENYIVLNDTVDLGVGYVEFCKGEQEHAVFTIESAAGEKNLLNSAGYVVNKGVELHLKLTNPEDYMYEWRKAGEGALYIDGTGNTNALLNLGGTGVNYLQQKDGHAAYNVLVNTGAVVVINDLNQIERDFTFGSGGGTLDMNGLSMEWYQTLDAEGRFTINALTEEAMITNTGDATTTLTFMESGSQTYAGSFSDSETGGMRIDYRGGGTWTLNSIHTDLSHHIDSGFSVSNGHVILAGTNTVHGMGSQNGRNPNRLEKLNDWHYADASMNVNVAGDATFELGSHARLDGDITVAGGGTFIMREGVKERYEYVEGSAELKDTGKYHAFYGLKGDVNLAAGANMRIEYNAGVSSAGRYDGNISGAGDLSIALGTSGATLTLGGDNSAHTGAKEIISGGVIFEGSAALGKVDAGKTWLVRDEGYIASSAFVCASDVLATINAQSTGTVALTESYNGELIDLSNHAGLTIGALAGHTVNYGNAVDTLSIVYDNDGQGYWSFGGGGGELVVHAQLLGDADLYLGSSAASLGTVTLTNTANNFTGDIIFRGLGIVLNAADGTLGNSKVTLTYSNAFVGSYAAITENIVTESDGILTVDKIASDSVDLRNHKNLALGAEGDNTTFSGDITLMEGAAYRFSTVGDITFRVASELASDRDIVVDAQGLSAGTVVLENLGVHTGNITVQGHRDSESGTGRITLGLAGDTRTEGALNVTTGGVVDLAGHTLTVAGELTGTGVIANSAASGELVLASEGDTRIANSLQAHTIRKADEGNLTLAGENHFVSLYVDAGTLTLGGADATSSDSSIYLADGTTLAADGYTAKSDIRVQSGAATLRHGAASTSTTISGNVVLASGTSLNFADGGTYALTGSQYGGQGAEMVFNGGTLRMLSNNSHEFAGTLLLLNNVRVESDGRADDMARSFAEVRIGGGKITLWEASWNTIWNVNALSGEGELNWHSNTTHDTTSRLILSGDGGFSGTISLDRDFSNASRTHGAFIELASDAAARNAAISLDGANSNAVASLAINTGNARIKGLSGNANSYVYAGASMANAELSGENRPASTRKATLTIDTDANKSYTYSGTVEQLPGESAHGLNVVKLGAGTQKFTGSVHVHDVSVQGGTLGFASDTTSIYGNVALASGATLDMVDFNYVLSADKSFVVSGSTADAAVYTGSLTLGGGLFSLDASALLHGAGSVLNIGGNISWADGCSTQVVTVQNMGVLDIGSYTLASGNWSLPTGNVLELAGTGAFTYSLSGGEDGLKLLVQQKDGVLVWNGTADSHIWSSSMLGSTTQQYSPEATALFSSSAQSKEVSVTENVAMAEAMFVGEGYAVTSAGGVATIGNLTKEGEGQLVLNSGIAVTGETRVNNGELVLKSSDLQLGTITGPGGLVIDWGDGVIGSQTINNLGALKLQSGTYSMHGGAYDCAVVMQGGTLHGAGGASLTGGLMLLQDSELQVDGNFYLSSAVASNGHTLTKTGDGQLHFSTQCTGLTDLVVSQGSIYYDSGSYTAGNISLSSGTQMVLDYSAGVQAGQIRLADGASIRLRNGGSGSTHLNADIISEDGAFIFGSLHGNNSTINGTISGSGTLNFGTTAGESNSYTVNSVISDGADSALSLRFSGGGVTLTGNNTYSGGTTINGGSVTANHTHALGSGMINLENGTLVLNAAMSLPELQGTGGTLQLNNAVRIQSQYMNFAGSVRGNGSLSTAENASISLSGNVNLDSLLVSSGSVSLSGQSNLNTLEVSGGSASLTGSTNIRSSIQVSEGASLTLGGNVMFQEMIQNAGTVYLTDGLVFDLDFSRNQGGVFTIIDGSGTICDLSEGVGVSFTLNGAPLTSEMRPEVHLTENTLKLGIFGLMNEIVWTGRTDGVWNYSSENWKNAEGDSARFWVLDHVSFGADAVNQDITLADNQTVSSMTISGGAYTFSGHAVNVQGDMELAAGASADMRSLLEVNGILRSAGNLALNVTSGQTMDVEITGGSLVKSGNAQLTWQSSGEFIRLDSLEVTAGSMVVAGAPLVVKDGVTLASGTALTLQHGSGTASLSDVNGAGATLSLNGAGSLELGDATVATLELKGDSNVQIGGAVAVSHLSLGKTSVELVDGAEVVTERYTSGNTANGQPTTLTISQGASLTVTGNNKLDETRSDMLLAHWKTSNSMLHLNGGELNVQNTFVLMGWDSGGTLKATSGTANLYGIHFSTKRTHADSFILGSATEGSAIVNIGGHGIRDIGSNDKVMLGLGTINATTDWEATGAGAITLVAGGQGTVLNTNGYNVTIKSGLNGSGVMTKQGAGQLIVAGNTADFAGMIDVQDGTLVANSALHHVLLSSGGSLEFGEGTTLASGMTLSGAGGVVADDLVLNGGILGTSASWLAQNATTAALTIASGYDISFAEGVTSQLVQIAGLEELTHGDYFLLSGSFADGISGDWFTLDGAGAGMNASFAVRDGGLWLTWSGAGDDVIQTQVWSGTTAAHTWTGSVFGDAAYDETKVVLFDDTASNRNVIVSGDVEADHVIFDNTQDYRITPGNLASELTVGTLEVRGSGAVRVASALNAAEISISKGKLLLSGAASQMEIDRLTMTDGASLNIGGSAVSLGEVSMTADTSIADVGALGSLTLTQEVSLQGTLNVGTVNVLAGAEFTAGAALHTLNVQAGAAVVNGSLSASDITLAGGASLQLAETYTLADASTLSILGSTIISGDLSLQGGTLLFDSAALQADAPVLTVNGAVAEGGSAVIDFTDMSRFCQGGTYQLASGMAAGTYLVTGEYGELASLAVDAGGTLSVTFVPHGIWNGTAEQFSWGANSFGSSSGLPEGAVYYFDDSAAYTQVEITDPITAKRVTFRNSGDYTLTAVNDGALTADSLSVEGSGQVNLNTDMSLSSATIKGNGTLNLSGTVSIDGLLSIGKGTVNLLDGAHVTAEQYRSGDMARDQASAVTINAGASLTITGTVDADALDTSFLLTHWHDSNSSLVLNGGTLTAENTCLHMGWDSAGRFEALSGTAELKGIRFTTTENRNHADSFILGSATVKIGSGGITGIGSNDTVQLGDGGTIAATANFSISGGTVTMSGTTTGTTFDTAGHTITMTSTLAGSGKMVKTGAGVLNLEGATTFTGDVRLEEGTLRFGRVSGNQALSGILDVAGDVSLESRKDGGSDNMLKELAHVNVAAGNTLHIRNYTWNTVWDIEKLTGSGTVALSTTTSHEYTDRFCIGGNGQFSGDLVVDSNSERKAYQAYLQIDSEEAVSGAKVTLTGTKSMGMALNAERVKIGGLAGGNAGTYIMAGAAPSRVGVSVASTRESTLVLTGSGEYTYGGIIGQSADTADQGVSIEMAGTGKQTFNGTHLWLNDITEQSGTLVVASENLAVRGSVLVNGGTLVVTSGNISVGGSVLVNGGMLELGSASLGMLTSASGVEVKEGATLYLNAGNSISSGGLDQVSGDGTVRLNYNVVSDNGTGFDFSRFSGTVQLDSGRLLVSSSTFGTVSPDIQLTSGNAQLVFNDTTGTELKSNVELLADITMHVNQSCAGTISGNLEGDFILTKAGAGTLTLGGNNSLKWISFSAGNVDIAADGCLNLSETKSGNVSLTQIGGAGTLGLKLESSDNYANTFALADSFTGTTYVQSGNFTINGSTYGNTLKLADGVNFQLTAGTTVSLENLVLEGSSQIHQNTTTAGVGARLDIYGTVTGDGTYNRRGTGTLTFHNTVNLGKFVQTAWQQASVETIFSSESTLGELEVTRGQVSLAEGAALEVTGEMKLAGTLNIAEGATLTKGVFQVRGAAGNSAVTKVSGNDNVVDFSKGNHKLVNASVTVNDTAGVTLGAKLEHSSVENAGSGTLTVNNSGNTLSGVVASGGNVVLSESMRADSIAATSGKQVSLAAGKSISVGEDNKVQLSSTGSTAATMTALSDNSLMQIKQDATFSIQDMQLSHMSISAAEDTEVVMSNVGALQLELSGGSFTMATQARVEQGATNLLSGITLNNTGGAATLTVDLGNLGSLGVQDAATGLYSMELTLNGFTMDYQVGRGLLFAADSWLGRLLAGHGAGAYVSGEVENEQAVALARTQTVAVVFSSAGTTGDSNIGTVIRITGLQVIPEPTTTTLSLLALSALVARRRRRG